VENVAGFTKNRNPLATNMKMMILETNHNF